MFLLPLIQLERGECVEAFPAPAEGEALPLTHPAEVAMRFQKQGAVGLHVVDIDAAVGKRPNDKALLSLVDAVHIPVQCAGGVRSLRRIQELRDTGVQRVCVGSMAVQHEDWMREAAKVFPKGLIVNFDVRDEHVWVKGRTEDTGKSAADLATRFDALGVEAFVFTQLNGAGPAAVEGLAPKLRTPLMFQGPIKNAGDLLALKGAGVRAAILGAEIYDGTLDFDALNKTFKAL